MAFQASCMLRSQGEHRYSSSRAVVAERVSDHLQLLRSVRPARGPLGRSPNAKQLLELHGFRDPCFLGPTVSPRATHGQPSLSPDALVNKALREHFSFIRSVRKSPYRKELLIAHGVEFSQLVPLNSPRGPPSPVPASSVDSENNSVTSQSSTSFRRSVRSRASRKASFKRRREWLNWRSQQHDDRPQDRIWLIADICRMAAQSSGPLGAALRVASRRVGTGRCRDIFPLAPVVGNDFKPVSWASQR